MIQTSNPYSIWRTGLKVRQPFKVKVIGNAEEQVIGKTRSAKHRVRKWRNPFLAVSHLQNGTTVERRSFVPTFSSDQYGSLLIPKRLSPLS